jgi:hypothetical protein
MSLTNCNKYKKLLPSFTPIIYSLSVTSSTSGDYSLVYINGENFFPDGITYVNFGSFKNLSVTYYSSFNISFVVPTTATAGTYEVIVVTVYSGNIAPRVLYSYLPNLNFSNSIQYTLT